MAKKHIMTPKEAVPGCKIQTDDKWLIVVPLMHSGHVLEVEDLHFHHNSHVVLPDYGDIEQEPETPEEDRVTGLAVLAECYRYSEDHPKQALLIAGHTDTSGMPGYNLALSQRRADNVLYILLGDREQWVKSVEKQHKVEDYQQILKWVSALWDWDCDPGEVNDKLNPETRSAIKEFQRSYNEEFREFKPPIPETETEKGVVGPGTWGAFFDLYILALIEILETDMAGLEQLRQHLKLRFLDDVLDEALKPIGCGKTVGCGQNFPIDQPKRANYRSRINRRVEILFFDPGEEPEMKCHPKPGVCVPAKCEIYNPKLYQLDHIPVKPITIAMLKRWVLRVLEAGPGPLSKHKPLPEGVPFVVTGAGGDAPEIHGKTDKNGILRIPMFDKKCTMTLKIAGKEFLLKPDGGSSADKDKWRWKLTLKGGALLKLNAPDETIQREAVKQRLYNLGYGKDKFDEWDDDTFTRAVKKFQKDEDLPNKTGTVDLDTRIRLKERYGS